MEIPAAGQCGAGLAGQCVASTLFAAVAGIIGGRTGAALVGARQHRVAEVVTVGQRHEVWRQVGELARHQMHDEAFALQLAARYIVNYLHRLPDDLLAVAQMLGGK